MAASNSGRRRNARSPLEAESFCRFYVRGYSVLVKASNGELSMIGQRTRIAVLVLVICGATSAASAQSFTPPGGGKPLFDGLCQDCHGLNGTGDEGPALNHPLGADDATLHKIIRDGIPERGMPRVRRMTEEEVDALVSYVKTLNGSGPAKVPGNAEKGRGVSHRLAGATCHVIGGQGGVLGPELTKIGQRR